MEISLLFFFDEFKQAVKDQIDRLKKILCTHKSLYEFVFYFFENSNNPIDFLNLCSNYNYLRNIWDPFILINLI